MLHAKAPKTVMRKTHPVLDTAVQNLRTLQIRMDQTKDDLTEETYQALGALLDERNVLTTFLMKHPELVHQALEQYAGNR